jgi:hypothetical protein
VGGKAMAFIRARFSGVEIQSWIRAGCEKQFLGKERT